MTTAAEAKVLEACVALAREQADRLMHRESTDFLGRMGEALCNAEECCPDGVMETDRAADYHEAMIELAALALAQAAMATGEDPVSDTAN